MYQSILVPTDGSELSLRAADAAIALAKALGARLVAWSSAEVYSLPFAEQVYVDQTLYVEEAMKEAATNAQAVATRAADAGVACQAFSGMADSIWEGIISAASEHGCDLIFMASHGRRGMAALLLGSETQKVLTHSKLPVLVYR
ncbi:MAG: universal stress protein [Xanthomonadaceae bacterium]|nr:universal stress protein [Xanthomonadaceae bacterium]